MDRPGGKKEIAANKWGCMDAYHFENVYMSGENDNAISPPFIH